jgi:hypothetical protein
MQFSEVARGGGSNLRPLLLCIVAEQLKTLCPPNRLKPYTNKKPTDAEAQVGFRVRDPHSLHGTPEEVQPLGVIGSDKPNMPESDILVNPPFLLS